MNVLGISAFFHDSAAAIISDGKIIAAAQEERFSRVKQDASFPKEALRFCLSYAGLSISELDAIVFYDKPFLKFERLLETYHVFAPRGLKSFTSFVPVWIKEKLFLKNLIYENLLQIEASFKPESSVVLFPEHHLSHAASAFFPSPFEEAAILTIDGVGEWGTATIMHGKDNKIRPLKELIFPHSVGLLYSAFTYFLGFKVNSGEYKLMGMAPYGNPYSPNVVMYKAKIIENLIDLKEDGSIWLNQDYFDYATGLKMIIEEKWENLFGFPTRPPESNIEQHHCDCALAIQQITEEIIIRMAKTAKKLTGAKQLCLAGGVALNCVANGKLLVSDIFDDIWVQPAAGDAGGALGAALAACYMHFECSRKITRNQDIMQGAFLGPEYSDRETEIMARRNHAVFHRYDSFSTLCDFVAEKISEGKIVGWHQGRMEWGPRALGNRSIIGDPRNPEMQKKLNVKIKYREGFRPFAPSSLIECTCDYFCLKSPSPYMLLTAEVKKERQKPLPENYYELPLWEKLYHLRSDIQAVTHLDFSARIQTVHKETNLRYWELINAFRKKTGYGLVVNTSFNIRGEPIVCTPTDSYRCFMATDIDILVIGNILFIKDEQPDHENKEKWLKKFDPD